MSKIKNGGLDQYGAEPFEQQQFGTADVEGLNNYLPKNKTSRDLDHAHFGQFVITEPVEKTLYRAVGIQGASHLYWGGFNYLALALLLPTFVYEGHRTRVNQILLDGRDSRA